MYLRHFTIPRLLLTALLSLLTYGEAIRCYSSLKYVVGQDIYQDSEECSSFLGIGEAYCYKFMEETRINEIVKMGCSNKLCNALRNTCMEMELSGMQGTICCCNDRHYCNGAWSKIRLSPLIMPFVLFFGVFVQVMLSI